LGSQLAIPSFVFSRHATRNEAIFEAGADLSSVQPDNFLDRFDRLRRSQ
jgi:hypothetical protein